MYRAVNNSRRSRDTQEPVCRVADSRIRFDIRCRMRRIMSSQRFIAVFAPP